MNELQIKAAGNAKFADRLKDAEQDLSSRKQALMGLTMRSQFIGIVMSLGSLWIISYLFDGVVVGKLPFTPIAWFSQMTHRRLEGDDFSDASYLFYFALANSECSRTPQVICKQN